MLRLPIATDFSIKVAVGKPARRLRTRHTPKLENSSSIPGETLLANHARNGQRERSLHLFARPHTSRADNALRRIKLKIRIGRVLPCSKWLAPSMP